MTCRRKKKGPALKQAYEDISLAPENPIDCQLLSSKIGRVSLDVEEIDVYNTPVPEVIENEEPSPTQDNSGALLGAMGSSVTKDNPSKDIRELFNFQ